MLEEKLKTKKLGQDVPILGQETCLFFPQKIWEVICESGFLKKMVAAQ